MQTFAIVVAYFQVDEGALKETVLTHGSKSSSQQLCVCVYIQVNYLYISTDEIFTLDNV